MTRGNRSRSAAALAIAGVLAVGVAAAVNAGPATAAPPNNPGRHPLTTGIAAPQARALAAGAQVRVSVSLNRDAAGLEAAARAASTPGSPGYRHFQSPSQVTSRFGTTAAQRKQVADWLRGSGLRVTHSGPFAVTGLGSAAQAQAAIGTGVGSVAVAAEGRTVTRYAARSRVSVPDNVAEVVTAVNLSPQAVTPLPTPQPRDPGSARATTTTTPAATTATTATTAKIQAPSPCSSYFGQNIDKKDPTAYGRHVPYSGCWYTPQMVRKAYGFPAGLTGKGVTVASVGSEPVPGIKADLQRWSREVGVQPLRKNQLTVVDQQEPGTKAPTALDEWISDLEAVHGLAPDANLTYVWSDGSILGDSYADDLSRIVDNRTADVVTASLGTSIYDDDIRDPLLQRAALEGITVNEASGDWGNAVDKSRTHGGYLRDTPWETIVGGTSLAIDKAGRYQFETPWAQASTLANAKDTAWSPAAPGTSEFYYEGGGGVSMVDEPWYQKGVARDNVVDGRAKRVAVDVSMEADCYVGGFPEGFYTPKSGTEVTKSWYTRTFCGTSMAAPMFAAVEANVIQKRGGAQLGFVNPTLYGFYGSTAYHQVTDTPLGAGVTLAVVRPGGVGSTPSPQSKLISLGQCAAQNATSKPFALVTPYCGPGYNEVTGLGSPTHALFGLLAGGRS